MHVLDLSYKQRVGLRRQLTAQPSRLDNLFSQKLHYGVPSSLSELVVEPQYHRYYSQKPVYDSGTL